ncbi:MAG TPA: hypothetical protein VN612_02090 [Acidobacteriaceae bacterium]|nr:hypothetical protein [Acidobacteriaceae bacterium]
MKQFAANDIAAAIRNIVQSTNSLPAKANNPVFITLIEKQLNALMECCKAADLKMSVLRLQRLRVFFDKPLPIAIEQHLQPSIMQSLLTIEDELSLQMYFSFTQKEAEMYQNPLQGWESVIAKFPKVRQNIEESAKCFALERYGASVFHVLQVAEYGVIEVARLLGVSGDKPGWGSLKRLQDLIKVPYPERLPLAQTHSKLLENVVPLAFVIKDNWRHKLDHVDNQMIWMDADFSPEVADDIISATRAFMRKLAFDLGESNDENEPRIPDVHEGNGHDSESRPEGRKSRDGSGEKRAGAGSRANGKARARQTA